MAKAKKRTTPESFLDIEQAADKNANNKSEKKGEPNIEDNNSSWKSPTIIIALGTLCLSIAANVYQYVDSNRKFTLEEAKLQLTKDGQISTEDQKKYKNTIALKEISAIDYKLDSLGKEVNSYEQMILKQQIDKDLAESKVSTATSEDGKKAYQRNVQIAENAIRNAKDDEQPLIELEKQLRSQRNELLKILIK